jgi:hypothetical protein
MQRSLALAALTLMMGFLAGLANAADQALSPRALVTRLLTTPIKQTQLPSGYYSAKVGVSKPSDIAKKHHVVGEVEIDLDSDAVIVYIVFPTRADALADWYGADLKKVKSRLPAPLTLPKPSGIFNTSITGNNAFGKKVTNGVTLVGFVSQNVIVEATNLSTDTTESGDVPGAIALARFALRHLSAVRLR